MNKKSLDNGKIHEILKPPTVIDQSNFLALFHFTPYILIIEHFSHKSFSFFVSR